MPFSLIYSLHVERSQSEPLRSEKNEFVSMFSFNENHASRSDKLQPDCVFSKADDVQENIVAAILCDVNILLYKQVADNKGSDSGYTKPNSLNWS